VSVDIFSVLVHHEHGTDPHPNQTKGIENIYLTSYSTTTTTDDAGNIQSISSQTKEATTSFSL
jgi:hypothetical protein